MKNTLQFVVLGSFSLILYSYFGGFPFFFTYNLQFSTLVFSLFAHTLDRKYMFIICNAILAFLAKNMKFGSSSLNHIGVMKNDGDGVKQIIELPAVLEKETVEASVEYVINPPNMTVAEEEEEQQQERDYGVIDKSGKEMKMGESVLESQEWEEGEEEEEDDDGFKENKASDASVSTEELNHKFEEFIRKMKEEIRIEAQQQIIPV